MNLEAPSEAVNGFRAEVLQWLKDRVCKVKVTVYNLVHRVFVLLSLYGHGLGLGFGYGS